MSKPYTQICFCSSVADTSSHSAIINALTSGLERLSASFPWLVGKVVNEGSGKGNSGVFKIKPLEKIPRLVVKDLRPDPSISTMDVLRQAKFPISMLDENIIAHRKTLPGSSDESTSDSDNGHDWPRSHHPSLLKSLPQCTIPKRRTVIRQTRPQQPHPFTRRLLQARLQARLLHCETHSLSSHL